MSAVNLTRGGRRLGSETACYVHLRKFSVGSYALTCGDCNVHEIYNL